MKKDTTLKNRFIVSLVIISLLLLFFDRFGFLNGIKSAYESLTSPIQKNFTELNQQILSFEDTISNLSTYKEKVETLESEVTTYRENQLKLDSLVKENESLRNQLKLKVAKDETLIESNIINFSDYNSPDYIVLDKGSQDSVKKGNVVVFESYAVGIVSDVRESTSDVELISSKNTNISVENISGSAKGVLKKDNKNRMLITLILPEEQIALKEQIITSGLNSPFPYGLLIGSVTSVDKSPNNFNQEAEVSKYLDFVKLHKVFVISKP